MLSNVTGWIKKLTEAGVGLVGLAIVVQVIFYVEIFVVVILISK